MSLMPRFYAFISYMVFTVYNYVFLSVKYIKLPGKLYKNVLYIYSICILSYPFLFTIYLYV